MANRVLRKRAQKNSGGVRRTCARTIVRTCQMAFAAVMAVTAMQSVAAAKSTNTYRFAGLEWGSSPSQVRKHLSKQGFRIIRVVAGPRVEFAMANFHGRFEKNDRGRRMMAIGKIAGERVTVDLIFGQNEKLGRVIVKSRYWDGTIRGARRMIQLAKTLVEMYEDQYGPARKIADDGWPDTATWRPASDGSRMQLYVRGVNGFMFSPSYKTALRVHFHNPRHADLDPGLVTVKSPKLAPLPIRKPKVETEEERKKRLRRLYNGNTYGDR